MNEEFLINSYLKKLSKNNPSSLNLNDDVFFDKNKKLVISVDTYNEGIHFLNFNKPDLVIRKIIRSSISDIYAKGVKPNYFFLAGSGNKKHFTKKNMSLINKSLSSEQNRFNIKLSGGDTTSSKIIIKEYLNASNFFIDLSQTKYLNALLDKISKKLRN